jgi:hypothetical protein
MAATDNLGQQFQPITAAEARGNSRPVTADEFQEIARAGAKFLKGTERRGNRGTPGLDKDWEGIKDKAYAASREPWGGATINAYHGGFIGDKGEDVAAKVAQGQHKGYGSDRFGITVKRPGQEQVQVSPLANREQFGAAMDHAKAAYPQLANRAHHLGVFNDADLKPPMIDFDPVLVVRTQTEAEEVGAATHAIGGAYHYASGMGFFPPHVKDEG